MGAPFLAEKRGSHFFEKWNLQILSQQVDQLNQGWDWDNVYGLVESLFEQNTHIKQQKHKAICFLLVEVIMVDLFARMQRIRELWGISLPKNHVSWLWNYRHWVIPTVKWLPSKCIRSRITKNSVRTKLQNSNTLSQSTLYPGIEWNGNLSWYTIKIVKGSSSNLIYGPWKTCSFSRRTN